MIQCKVFTWGFLLLSFGFTNSWIVHAEVVEVKDYTVMTNPQPTQDINKIEVLEFFWYGCPHCYSLHPHLKAWSMNISSDINFRYVPAIFQPNWIAAAKIFYALEALGMINTFHDKVYEAFHNERINLNIESVLFEWIEKQGVDRKRFENIYKSFAVQNQVARSTQMSRQYQLTAVPALIVDGKYLISVKRGSTPQDMIKTLEMLIDKAAQLRFGK